MRAGQGVKSCRHAATFARNRCPAGAAALRMRWWHPATRPGIRNAGALAAHGRGGVAAVFAGQGSEDVSACRAGCASEPQIARTLNDPRDDAVDQK